MEEGVRLVEAVENGDDQSAVDLLPLAYQELRRLAAAKMSAEREGHTLEPTALVHEAYIKLLGSRGEGRSWTSQDHFFAAAADAMRKVLIDSARKRLTLKRGGEFNRINWDEENSGGELSSEEILAVDAALGRLEQQKPELAQLVKLRYFAGFSIAETAAALGVSESSVDRSWRGARVWLYREICRETEGMGDVQRLPGKVTPSSSDSR